MAETQAISGYGTTLKIGATEVEEVTSVGEPGSDFDLLEATHLTSPDRYKEWIAGLKDGIEVPCEANFIPGATGQTALLTAHQNQARNTFTVTWPNSSATKVSFSAYVKSFRPGPAQPNGKLTLKFTLRITSSVNFNA